MNSGRALRLGVAGLGRAFQLMAPGLVQNPKIQLVAAADPRPEARTRFAADFSACAYDTVEKLCTDDHVEAVYISTPHQFHAEHVTSAARNGKHVLVEKPMALTLDDCRAMIRETAGAGVQMVIGHSHSFDLPVRRTRELISGGQFGALHMITAVNFTDFLYRPRRPEELQTKHGGGVMFNQAPHHVDVARLLAASPVISVRTIAGAWDGNRPTEGAYSCLMAFKSGAFASLTYNGYAHFDSDELMGWIAESGLPKDPDIYGTARALLMNPESRQSELAIKNARNYGCGDDFIPQHDATRLHQHFGVLLASCDRADLRPMPGGVAIYGNECRTFDSLPPPVRARSEVIDEFYDAVVENRPALHDGAWGLATTEVCLAMLQSAREQREVRLDG
jgi:phthalate 4,5-cis-dihydrodiol dehydrogenase